MIKKIIREYIKIIQKIFITAVLFILYIFGFGITLIFVTIFNKKLLKAETRKKDTCWKDTEGYENDINDCIRES